MHLTIEEIEYKLENIESCSIKDIVDIITNMFEHISYLERAYISLSMNYDKLENNYAKLHLNSMYGKMVNDTFEADKIISDAMNVLKENADDD